MSRRWLLAVGAAVLAGVVIALLLRPAPKPARTGRASVGLPAPSIDAVGLDGRKVRLADYRGRTVLINFWASWCTPCRQEFPLFRQLLSSDPSVAVIGVVFQDGRTPAAGFAHSEGATWPSALDPNGRIAAAYGVTPKPGIPVTFVINPAGVVVAKHLGPITTAAIPSGT